MIHNDDTCDDADSTTTIFSTSSQGSAVSIMSTNSSDIAKLKSEIDSSPDDLRKEALALVNSLLEQRENAIHLLDDISNRPPPEPYESPEDAALLQDAGEAEAPAEPLDPRLEERSKISSKEFFRRIRQRLTKQQFKQFVKNMQELNKLREERAVTPFLLIEKVVELSSVFSTNVNNIKMDESCAMSWDSIKAAAGQSSQKSYLPG